MNHIKKAFSSVEGGIPVIAKACGVSVRAAYKWAAKGKLPRTDYTKETEYAKIIAKLPGAKFSSDELLFPKASSRSMTPI